MRAERRHGLVAQRLRRQIVLEEERLEAIHLAAAPGDDHNRALDPERFEVGEGLGEGTALDPDADRLWAVRFEMKNRTAHRRAASGSRAVPSPRPSPDRKSPRLNSSH